MGILGTLFSFKRRDDPGVEVVRSLIDDMTKSGTFDLFNKPIFKWDIKKSDRHIEATILSRFFLDYSLIKLSEERSIKTDAVEAVRNVIMLGFIAYLQRIDKNYINKQSNKDHIRSKMLKYLKIMRSHEMPICWLKLSEELTDRSYENDPEVLISASLQLPIIQAAALHNVRIILDGAISCYE